MITGADSKVVLERWVFNVETDKSVRADGYVDLVVPDTPFGAGALQARPCWCGAPAPHCRMYIRILRTCAVYGVWCVGRRWLG